MLLQVAWLALDGITIKIADKGRKVKAILNTDLLKTLDTKRPPSYVSEGGIAIINGSAVLKADPDPEPEISYISTIIGARIRLQSVHFPGEYVHAAENQLDKYRRYVLTYHDGRLANYDSDWLIESAVGFPNQIRLMNSGYYLYVSDGANMPLIWRGIPNADVLSKSRFSLEVGQ